MPQAQWQSAADGRYWIDVALAGSDLVRNVLLAVMSSLAKVEAQKIGERTKAGMAGARAAGKRIGRPALPQKVLDRIATLSKRGASAYRIGKELGIDHKTAARYQG